MTIEEEGIFQLYNLVSEHPSILKEAFEASRNGSAKCKGRSKFKRFVNPAKQLVFRTFHVSINFRFPYTVVLQFQSEQTKYSIFDNFALFENM